VSALRRDDDIGDVLSALVLVAAAMGTLLAIMFLQHFADESTVFCSIVMSPAASFARLAVKTMFMPFPIDMTAVLPRGMSFLEIALACVNVVRRDGPIRFEVVILFPWLVRIDGTAALIMEATTGNLVSAGFLDLMCSVGVERVHCHPSH